MHILHIIPQLGAGGAERFCVDLCNEQSKYHKVTLCVLHDLSKEQHGFFLKDVSSNINVECLAKKKGFDLFVVLRIMRILRSCRPDIINSHLSSLLYVVIPANILRIPVLHTMHNIASKEQESSFLRNIYKLYFRAKLAKPIAISNLVRSSIGVEYKLTSIPMIENGVLKPNLSSRYDDVKRQVDKLKLDPQTRVFLCVARLSEQKNIELLISAINIAVGNGGNLILLIIGDGDDGIKLKLKGMAGERIYFLGTQNNIADYMSCSDVLCLSSKWEGLPITILEAFSLGLVVLATPVGGIPDVIIDGKSGFVSESLNVRHYVNLIDRYMLQSPEELERMRQIAKQAFKQRFDMKITSENYIGLYEKLVHKDRSA